MSWPAPTPWRSPTPSADASLASILCLAWPAPAFAGRQNLVQPPSAGPYACAADLARADPVVFAGAMDRSRSPWPASTPWSSASAWPALMSLPAPPSLFPAGRSGSLACADAPNTWHAVLRRPPGSRRSFATNAIEPCRDANFGQRACRRPIAFGFRRPPFLSTTPFGLQRPFRLAATGHGLRKAHGLRHPHGHEGPIACAYPMSCAGTTAGADLMTFAVHAAWSLRRHHVRRRPGGLRRACFPRRRDGLRQPCGGFIGDSFLVVAEDARHSDDRGPGDPTVAEVGGQAITPSTAAGSGDERSAAELLPAARRGEFGHDMNTCG